MFDDARDVAGNARHDVGYELQWSTPGAEGAGPVTRVRLREGLSELYRCRVDVLAAGPVEDRGEADLGRRGTLVLRRDALARKVHGVVCRVEDAGRAGDGRWVRRYTLVPALWALSLRVNFRIFQGQDAAAILAALLREAGLYPGAELAWTPRRGHVRREYCVQYGESDLAFVRRLLAEDGIAFAFDHGGVRERLVLVDDLDALPWLRGRAEASALAVADEGSGDAGVEAARGVEGVRRACPARVTTRDYDFTYPFHTDATHPAGPGGGPREVFVWPGGYDMATRDDARRAQTRHERETAGARTLRGESNVASLVAGARVRFAGGDAAGAGRYVVTRVAHEGATRGARAGYANRFECVPAGGAHRPRGAARRPVVPGPQTATVVGRDDGDPICTDEHGRVKVQFHWDREGRSDERSSCWLRVAQGAAGAQFGNVFLPRVGMEVVVAFLDGDPDRPLVVGAVYNGANRPPYPLPEERTRSVIRTQLVAREGERPRGHNELSFEDGASPEIYLHTPGDLREAIGHDRRTTAGRDVRARVGRDRVTAVGRHDTVTAEKDWRVSAGEKARVDVGRNHIEATPTGVDIGTPETAPNAVRLVCGASEIIVKPEGIVLSTGHGATIELRGATINVRGGSVNVHGEGTVNVTSARHVVVRSDVTTDIQGAQVRLNC